MTDCLICAQIGGVRELPGGALVADEHAVGFHIPPLPDLNPQPYLGHLIVVTRRHVDHLGDLTADEAAAVGRASQRLAAALRAEEDVERVHVAVIGLGVPHFHQHLFPRRAGTPRDAEWTALDELPGAPHGGAEEVAAYAARLRRRLRSSRAA